MTRLTFVFPQVLTLLLLFLFSPCPANADTTNLYITADNSIIDVEGEREYNMGAASSIRMKAFQHHVILKFNTAGFTNRIVTAATIRYYEDNADDLTHVTVSTMQGDWAEGSSPSFATSEGGSCFDYARYSSVTNNRSHWAWKGSKFPDIAYGNCGSLPDFCDTRMGSDGNTYYEWDIDPDLVTANFVGASYGLAIFESSRVINQNRTVYSDESSRKPFITVTWTNGTITPGAISDLSGSVMGVDRGEVRLTWTSPQNAFAYRITYTPAGGLETAVPRHLIPYAGSAGQAEEITITDILSPGSNYTFKVQAVSRSGAASAQASVSARASSIESVPGRNISYRNPFASVSNGYSNAVIKVWAMPETEKALPGGTFIAEDNIPSGYINGNPVFDGKTIRLNSARNETVAFLLCLQAISSAVSNLSVSVQYASGVTGVISRVGYINTAQGYMPEIIHPAGGIFSTRMDENAASVQKLQQVLVELLVGKSAGKGAKSMSVSVSNGSSVNFTIPVELNVWDFALPDKPYFDLEMNDYGLPTYLATYDAIQRLAHKDRAHLNILSYGTSRTRMDMYKYNGILMNEAAYTNIAPGATTTYWTDFTNAFNPTLSGSLYTQGLRLATPPGGFYLTFHESWPLRYESYYATGEMDAYKAFTSHPEYARTFVNLLSNFVQIAQSRAWTNVGFQVYFNNKQNPWDFDEPYDFWDFRALSYFSDLFDTGAAARGNLDLKYRVDISRPQYQRKQLDGKMDLAVVGREMFTYNRLVRSHAKRDGMRVWNYSAAADVYKSSHNEQGWPLLAYAFGAQGIVPWSTLKYVDGDHNYMAGVTNEDYQQLALYIVKTDSQAPEVYTTLRMKAFRRGGQDCDYLELAKEAGGYTDGQIQRMVLSAIGSSATVKVNPGYVEDAGTLEFAGLSEAAFHILRTRAAKIIEGKGLPKISEVSVSNDFINLTLDNIYTGTACRVEKNSELVSGEWQGEPDFNVTAHETNWSGLLGAQDTAFFRFRQLVGDE